MAATNHSGGTLAYTPKTCCILLFYIVINTLLPGCYASKLAGHSLRFKGGWGAAARVPGSSIGCCQRRVEAVPRS